MSDFGEQLTYLAEADQVRSFNDLDMLGKQMHDYLNSLDLDPNLKILRALEASVYLDEIGAQWCENRVASCLGRVFLPVQDESGTKSSAMVSDNLVTGIHSGFYAFGINDEIVLGHQIAVDMSTTHTLISTTQNVHFAFAPVGETKIFLHNELNADNLENSTANITSPGLHNSLEEIVTRDITADDIRDMSILFSPIGASELGLPQLSEVLRYLNSGLTINDKHLRLISNSVYQRRDLNKSVAITNGYFVDIHGQFAGLLYQSRHPKSVKELVLAIEYDDNLFYISASSVREIEIID